MPVVVSMQRTRRAAFSTAFAYYAAAAWPLLPGAKAFFGAQIGWPESTLIWLTSAYLLALPYGIFRTSRLRFRPVGILCALLVTTVPPLGVIGWASPLTAAGVLFPGAAWLGLAATAALCSLLGAFPRLIAARMAAFVLIAHVAYHEPIPPSGWQAVDTHFGAGFDPANPLREFQAAESIQLTALESDHTVLVFPEMVVHRWTEVTDTFWEATLSRLRQEGRSVLIGAGLPMNGSRSYLNGVIVRGSCSSPPFIQRIPVPLAMWKPLLPTEGVPLRLWSRGTLTIGDQRAAILICYEQLLTWPMLTSALEHPTMVIGIANNHWAAGTPIPAVQRSCLRAWSRLFRLPFLSASNT
jgi:hypothetical protein